MLSLEHWPIWQQVRWLHHSNFRWAGAGRPQEGWHEQRPPWGSVSDFKRVCEWHRDLLPRFRMSYSNQHLKSAHTFALPKRGFFTHQPRNSGSHEDLPSRANRLQWPTAHPTSCTTVAKTLTVNYKNPLTPPEHSETTVVMEKLKWRVWGLCLELSLMLCFLARPSCLLGGGWKGGSACVCACAWVCARMSVHVSVHVCTCVLRFSTQSGYCIARKKDEQENVKRKMRKWHWKLCPHWHLTYITKMLQSLFHALSRRVRASAGVSCATSRVEPVSNSGGGTAIYTSHIAQWRATSGLLLSTKRCLLALQLTKTPSIHSEKVLPERRESIITHVSRIHSTNHEHSKPPLSAQWEWKITQLGIMS